MPSTNMDWHENSYIKVEQANAHLTRITVNREGLLSLSEHFKVLANSGNEGSVKSYAQNRFWSLVEIYYRGRLNRPLATFQQAGRKGSRVAVRRLLCP